MNNGSQKKYKGGKIVDQIKSYGLGGAVQMLGYLLYTRLCFRNARIVRPPIYLRGRDGMIIGPGLTTGRFNRIEVFNCFDAGEISQERHRLYIGSNVQMNDSNHISAIEHVSIGDYTLIASRVFITDHNHGNFDIANPAYSPKLSPDERPLTSKPVRIGRRVWIGEQVCVLPGVTIGDGAVIGAGSIVTRDIPSGCLAVGNPARVIRCFNNSNGMWEKL
jgi:lipopolysaccharide O-acetyltransferase